MTSTGSIHFTDRDSGDDAWIGVRVQADDIGLVASLKMTGDLEVFFGVVEAEALRDALTKAIETTGGTHSA
jgi:hypothetical protein